MCVVVKNDNYPIIIFVSSFRGVDTIVAAAVDPAGSSVLLGSPLRAHVYVRACDRRRLDVLLSSRRRSSSHTDTERRRSDVRVIRRRRRPRSDGSRWSLLVPSPTAAEILVTPLEHF